MSNSEKPTVTRVDLRRPRPQGTLAASSTTSVLQSSGVCVIPSPSLAARNGSASRPSNGPQRGRGRGSGTGIRGSRSCGSRQRKTLPRRFRGRRRWRGTCRCPRRATDGRRGSGVSADRAGPDGCGRRLVGYFLGSLQSSTRIASAQFLKLRLQTVDQVTTARTDDTSLRCAAGRLRNGEDGLNLPRVTIQTGGGGPEPVHPISIPARAE